MMKWCWSRLPGGIVTWEAYELFRIGEQGRLPIWSFGRACSFSLQIPRMRGTPLQHSYLLAWYQMREPKSFLTFSTCLRRLRRMGKTMEWGGGSYPDLEDGGLSNILIHRVASTGVTELGKGSSKINNIVRDMLRLLSAADATSHLFFAYLRSLSPDSVKGLNGIATLPISLQNLLQATEYPPERSALMQTPTTKVAMIVDKVSTTPFALLRRAKHFEYRDDDEALQQFSDYEDPLHALTDECRRVLKNISSANDSSVSNSKQSTGLRDASWSRFEDIGFGALADDSDNDNDVDGSALGRKRPKPQGLRSTPSSKNNLGRPTTPSWADFLSSGFVDEPGTPGPSPLLLPPDKILPPINTRGGSSQSNRHMPADESQLEPGELASITNLNLDDAFWWVWISSLAGEEPTERKAAFGRCALIETKIQGGKWLVMEEIVKGAAPEPEAGAYIAEKKSRFGFSKRSRLAKNKSSGIKQIPPSKPEPYQRSTQASPMSKSSIAPDQHARIQAAAAALQQKHQLQAAEPASPRRARHGDATSTKTDSVFTLQPVIMNEAGPAMKWANSYDKSAIRAAYLGNNFTGKGSSTDLLSPDGPNHDITTSTNGVIAPMAPAKADLPRNESYGFPRQASGMAEETVRRMMGQDRGLPALPQEGLGTPARETPAPSDYTQVCSPAPLPATPGVDMRIANDNAAEAAKIELPSTTPMETPRSVERKAVPPRQEEQTLTSAREPEYIVVEPQVPGHGDANGYCITDSSPESMSPDLKKLKKRGAGAGAFKGLFANKKKPDVPIRPALNSPPSSTAAVAAARAALQPKPHQSQPQLMPPPPKMTRRFSGAGRKKVPVATPVTTPNTPLPSHDIHEEHSTAPAENTPVATLPYSPPHDSYTESQTSISRVDTNKQRQAEQEFRTFDQGPLEDQPAFVPDDSPTRISPALDRPAEDQATPKVADDEQQDHVSEKSIDLSRQMSPQDRWAQIRKNAAERAARQNEEQSKRMDRTDDGETSGEESKCLPSKLHFEKNRSG